MLDIPSNRSDKTVAKLIRNTWQSIPLTGQDMYKMWNASHIHTACKKALHEFSRQYCKGFGWHFQKAILFFFNFSPRLLCSWHQKTSTLMFLPRRCFMRVIFFQEDDVLFQRIVQIRHRVAGREKGGGGGWLGICSTILPIISKI